MESDFKQIQIGTESILNTKTTIRRRRRSQSDKKKELFNALITTLEEIRIRQASMYSSLHLDFSTYDETFFSAIDMLLHMNFGSKCADIIGFYIYDRVNPDGSINHITVNGSEQVFLNDPYELWRFLCQINPKLDE